MPLEIPSRPWEGVTMDFVTDLPESMALGYTGIHVIVDQLTKMAISLPCWKDSDSPELARLIFDHVICKCGVPDNIVTDRGTQFTSRFWTRVCSHLSTDHRRSTAIHPQTDGQTERQNQTMEQYLRAFCNYERDNWVELLRLAEFAYNNAIHTSTRMTPFWANYHYHPVMQFKALKQPSSLKSEIQPDTVAAGLEETYQTLRRNLQEAEANQTKYAGGKEVVFEVGDKVWLSTRHFRTTRLSKKLDYKRTGPYTVSKVINKNAYKLHLPYTIRKHNVLHVSLLDHYTPPTAGQPPSEPQPTVVDDSDEWEVDRILDSK
jgi:transposase InsO family protein